MRVSGLAASFFFGCQVPHANIHPPLVPGSSFTRNNKLIGNLKFALVLCFTDSLENTTNQEVARHAQYNAESRSEKLRKAR